MSYNWLRKIAVLAVLATLCSLVSPIHAQPPGRGRPSSGNAEESKEKEEKKADEKSEDKKDGEEASKTVKRSEYQPDLKFTEITLQPDADGKVKFNFQGMPWPPVLSWLAKFSRLNLDWQELPGDYLNLRTQQAYTPDEARDIINRHLLLRGFTLLQHDELLTVAQISTLNPGLVPRVKPEDLAERMPHEFVKVSFPLDWLLAEESVEQFKPMLSSNGKLNAIKPLNRLEAMDAVTNLSDIYNLLQSEQSSTNERTLVREFKLKHVRAAKVLDSLYGILGIDKPQTPSGNIDSSMGRQIMQQLQQMQRQSSSSKGGGGSEPQEPKLVMNERENSILAHATPDKMEVIEQTVEALDVPSDRESLLQQTLDRMQVYHLSTLDPQPLVDILQSVGNLSPTAKVQVDEDSRSIIVFGSLSDHYVVKSLVDRLDGSARSFEVIPLRRLRAIEVAGTIQYILGEDEDDDDSNSRSRYSYYSSYYSRGNDSKKEEKRPFRVEADIENNRLLVWANEVELSEIQNLLVKMGEIPATGGNNATTRVLELDNDENVQQLLERLQKTWPNIEPNQLNVQPAPGAEENSKKKDNEPELKPTADRKTATIQEPLERFVAYQANDESHPLQDVAANSDAPPITIQQLPNGRILINSPDTKALDRLELFIEDITPPPKDFEVFEIKHAWPFGIELILTDFFESQEDEQTIRDWWGNSVTVNEAGPSRLSTQRKLKIISDDDSMTLLVQGASPEQLETIRRLLEIYDKPESSDPNAIRVTKLFAIQHSKAQNIADTIKSVYRDLLSSNDPSLQNGQNGNKSQGPERSYTYVYGNSNQNEQTPEQPIKFKGLLSVGVDEISNTLVVSAANGLMDDISQLVETLDTAARPTTTVQVLQMPGSINLSTLKERLDGAFGQGGSGKVSVSSTGDRDRKDQPKSEVKQPVRNGDTSGN